MLISEEYIGSILAYCTALDRLRLACVCARLTIEARTYRSVEVCIRDDRKNKLPVAALASLFSGIPPACLHLRVGCRNLTDEMLKELLGTLPYLQTLDLSGCRLISSDDTFHWIARHCPLIRCLDIGGCGCVPVHLTHQYTVRSHLPALNTWISRYTLTDSTLRAIGSLSQLTSVSLYDCLAVSEQGLIEFITNQQLTELDVGETLGHASRFRIRISDTFVESLSTSPSVDTLQRLSLRGSPTLSPRSFAALAGFRHLNALDLAYTRIGVSDLVAILQNVTLTNLNLAGVSELAKPNCPLRDILPFLGSLKFLSLHGLQSVKDVFVSLLVQSCPDLEDLNLSTTGVKRASMPLFLQLRKLRTLNLRCCEHIRVQETDELRAAFSARRQLVIVLGQEKLMQMNDQEASDESPRDDYTWWPIDLTRLPRNEGLKSMVKWRGFKHTPGDVVRDVLQQVHPLARFSFKPVMRTESFVQDTQYNVTYLLVNEEGLITVS